MKYERMTRTVCLFHGIRSICSDAISEDEDEKGKLVLMKVLLDNGGNIHEHDSLGKTPLMQAIYNRTEKREK